MKGFRESTSWTTPTVNADLGGGGSWALGESGCENEQPHNGGDRGNEAGGPMRHHVPLNLNGESGRTKYTTKGGFAEAVR